MNDVYIVKKGDTLYGISNQFGVSVTELANINNVDANTLKEGQSLIIPSQSGSNPDNMFLYTVKKGDTLYGIARIYNVSVDSIKKLNYFTDNNLVVGQVIRIPEMYTKPEDMIVPNYVNYTVKKGDTLYSIAKKYGVLADTIIQDNALKNANLSVGQNLKIRVAPSSFEVEECFGEDSNIELPKNNIERYVVQKGDTLYSISKKFNTSVNNIVQFNNLNGNVLNVGQVLQIPISSYTYVVKRGDTLYGIANKFQKTVDDIKKKNNLSTNNLTIGQQLLI